MNIKFLDNEYWYGGVVHRGFELPISAEDDTKVELVGGPNAWDQYSPLFLSSKGRYLYSDKAFDAYFCKGEIKIDDAFDVELGEGYQNLKGAQQAVAEKYFNLKGQTPDLNFFKAPQYNTWIELMYNQNQKQILEYAHSMISGGMPPGVLMIDEGWAPDYGTYEFDTAKFDNPKAMVDELHEMGFKVMLWMTPMISPDSNCFRELRYTDMLIKDENDEPAIRSWWNGYSCVLDFTNPKTKEWFKEKLHSLMGRYGIDGFKFDSGDTYLYRATDKTYIQQEPNEHTRVFNITCGEFEFNEFRNVWNCGGVPLICRLQDKEPRWDERGVATLIPNMLTQGILGYFFGCPDMVGGGAYGAFLSEDYHTDDELYLRWLSASVLCPMMQFSISPKRILSDESFVAVQKLLKIRADYTARIVELVKNASNTGEPVLRYMEYEFPDCGYEKITDQFMLGKNILVAPIMEKETKERTVLVPCGKWKLNDGTIIDGGKEVIVKAELYELPILERI